MSVQWDRYNDPMMSTSLAAFGDGFDATPSNGFMPAFGTFANGADSISRFLNPQEMPDTGETAGSGSTSLVQQLLSVITQFLGNTGAGGYGGGYENGYGGQQQYFTSASGGSNGDPHLSFNGSTWNDMQSEGHLLDSNSIPGGYRLSTQTTPPNANGITYNQQATLTTDYGRTQVTLANDGDATYTQNGVTENIANGQTVNLGNGQSVTRAQNGSLCITSTAPDGGKITTTMSQNGSGVNVNVTANDVDLGGALVNGANGANEAPSPQPSPSPFPIQRPMPIRYAD